MRSKTDVAMAKILVHSICCLVQSIFEIGIERTYFLGGREQGETGTRGVRS